MINKGFSASISLMYYFTLHIGLLAKCIVYLQTNVVNRHIQYDVLQLPELLFTIVPITSEESNSWSCACVRVDFVQTHISVTAGRIFIILGLMMGYDDGLMPVVSKC